MRRYEEKTRKVTREELVELHCDMCGKKAKGWDWDKGYYEVKETDVSVTVKYTEGESYPEGGWKKDFSVDICPTCFKERLIPWLISQGVKITEKEWDF